MAFKASDRPLEDRLGLTAESRWFVLGAPPAGYEDWPGSLVEEDAGVVIVWCRTVADVERFAREAWQARRDGGRLWFAYRKGRRDLTRAQLGGTLDEQGLGLTWFRQIAIDGTWSAIWFKHRREFKTLNH